jgi:hypothetical protein
MVEDITTALSRFQSLFAIARNSSFTYKGKAIETSSGSDGIRRAICSGGKRRKAWEQGTHYCAAYRSHERRALQEPRQPLLHEVVETRPPWACAHDTASLHRPVRWALATALLRDCIFGSRGLRRNARFQQNGMMLNVRQDVWRHHPSSSDRFLKTSASTAL